MIFGFFLLVNLLFSFFNFFFFLEVLVFLYFYEFEMLLTLSILNFILNPSIHLVGN